MERARLTCRTAGATPQETMQSWTQEGRIWYPDSKEPKRSAVLKRYLRRDAAVVSLRETSGHDIQSHQLPSPGASRLPHPKTARAAGAHPRGQQQPRRRRPRPVLRLRHDHRGRAKAGPALDRHRHHPPLHRPDEVPAEGHVRPGREAGLRGQGRAGGPVLGAPVGPGRPLPVPVVGAVAGQGATGRPGIRRQEQGRRTRDKQAAAKRARTRGSTA